MTFKKAQPKLSDSIAVLAELIEKLEKGTVLFLKSNEILSDKIDKIYTYTPKLNLSNFKEIAEQNKAEIQEVHLHFLSKIEEYVNQIKPVKIETKSNDQYFSSYMLLIITLFIMLLISLYFVYNFKNNYIKNENYIIEIQESKRNEEQKFEEFLNDKKLISTYKHWSKKQ